MFGKGGDEEGGAGDVGSGDGRDGEGTVSGRRE